MSTTQRVLVVLDGAAQEDADADGTSLARARTPALDALARRGALRRQRTTPDGLSAGSEVGLPTLLGWPPAAAPSRGRIDAAAHGIDVPPGAACHRVDVRHADGRPWPQRAADARSRLAAANPGHDVRPLAGHRLLAVGPGAPSLPPATERRRGAGTARPDRPCLNAWEDGDELLGVLDPDDVLLCAPHSTAAGVARVLGGRALHPRGLTGEPGEDHAAAARTAVGLVRDGASLVVVHVGGPDQAAHRLDPVGKVGELERADRALIAPLAAACADVGAALAVTSDHATSPRTGRHGAAPVPALLADPGAPPRRGRPATPGGAARLTETACADRPLVEDPFAA